MPLGAASVVSYGNSEALTVGSWRTLGAHKYHAKPTVTDGIRFASKAEAARYLELVLLQRAGAIRDLELQPAFPITVYGRDGSPHTPIVYVADFRYRSGQEGILVVEDVKGVRTPVYRLKKKLVEAQYGITITEIGGAAPRRRSGRPHRA